MLYTALFLSLFCSEDTIIDLVLIGELFYYGTIHYRELQMCCLTSTIKLSTFENLSCLLLTN